MSAWVVSPRHIDYMVEAIRELGITQVKDHASTRGAMIGLTSLTDTDLGRMLMWENVRSVSERYPYDTFESLPGPVDKKRVVPYRYRKSGLPFNTLAVLKASECYVYQSCEHRYWQLSTSFAITEAIKDRMEAILPFRFRRMVDTCYGEGEAMFYHVSQEYDGLPWGIDEDSTFGPMEPVDPKLDAVVEAEAVVRRIV